MVKSGNATFYKLLSFEMQFPSPHFGVVAFALVKSSGKQPLDSHAFTRVDRKNTRNQTMEVNMTPVRTESLTRADGLPLTKKEYFREPTRLLSGLLMMAERRAKLGGLG
jgi:hypothetical protein